MGNIYLWAGVRNTMNEEVCKTPCSLYAEILSQRTIKSCWVKMKCLPLPEIKDLAFFEMVNLPPLLGMIFQGRYNTDW